MTRRATPQPQPLPLYRQIAESLRARIAAGMYPPNSMLPSRRDLAHDFRTAQPTVDRAIAVLAAEGLLRVDNRRGTFVLPLAPAAGPVHRSEERTAHPVVEGEGGHGFAVGIITTVHTADEGDANHHLWATTISSALEAAIVAAHGTVHSMNRYRAGEPLRPLPEIIADLRVLGVDALALISDVAPFSETVTALEASGLPFVIQTAIDVPRPISAVIFDNHSAGYLAVRHLRQAGHRQFTFISPFTDDWIEERLAGVRDAVRDSGLPADALRVFPEERPPAEAIRRSTFNIYQEPAYAAARDLFSRGEMATAVITVNDLAAFGVQRAAEEMGLAAGRDFALIGFDDHPLARFQGLTTQRPPLQAMGEEAARLLLALLRDGERRMKVRLQPVLVPRASTAPLAAQPSTGIAARPLG